MTLQDEKLFFKDIKKLLYKKDPLTEFSDYQKTSEQMKLKVGILEERFQKVNELIDKRFEKASVIFLDEEVLMKNINKQLYLEENVIGKPLFPMKSSIFV